MSNYSKIVSRKRSWTPVAVDKGQVKEGSEDTLKRCLALRCLELPVKEMLQQGLERDLPDDPGVIPALLSNMKMKTSMIVLCSSLLMSTALTSELNGRPKESARLGSAIRAIRSSRRQFLNVRYSSSSCPFFRFNGDMGIRTVAAISPVTSKPTQPSTRWLPMTWVK